MEKVILTDFWTKHPIDGSLNKAINMVIHELDEAKEKHKVDDDGYKKELCDAYVKLEHILTELNLHPSEYGY